MFCFGDIIYFICNTNYGRVLRHTAIYIVPEMDRHVILVMTTSPTKSKIVNRIGKMSNIGKLLELRESTYLAEDKVKEYKLFPYGKYLNISQIIQNLYPEYRVIK